MSDTGGHALKADTLLQILELDQLDRDLFRASYNARNSSGRLYGGQVCAQALAAAYRTVPEERFVHSLHGYFLRTGDPGLPVLLHVQRSRDGRSFVQRNVLAVQEGEVIFTMSASFHMVETGGELETRPFPKYVPAPDSVAPSAFFGAHVDFWDFRFLYPDHDDDEMADRPSPRMWARTRRPLPDDRIVWDCLIAYLSDFSTGFGGHRQPDLPRGGPSLDHAVWFHRPTRPDAWLLMDMWAVWAGGGRGLYHGAIYEQGGPLVASFTQESLLRLRL
ncbi:MAG: acyl-CoA thioesterase [Acidimicrobiia bacterium]